MHYSSKNFLLQASMYHFRNNNLCGVRIDSLVFSDSRIEAIAIKYYDFGDNYFIVFPVTILKGFRVFEVKLCSF